MEENSAYVFICEDQDVSREIMEKYFPAKKVTYAAIYPGSSRSSIVNAIATVPNKIYVANQPQN